MSKTGWRVRKSLWAQALSVVVEAIIYQPLSVVALEAYSEGHQIFEVARGARLVAGPVARQALVCGVALVADAAAGVDDPLGHVVG